MIVRELLNNVNSSIAHISNSNGCGWRLRFDKPAQILEMGAEACAGGVIQQAK
jgi:hypothetical protein